MLFRAVYIMQKKHRIFIAINLAPDVKKFLAGFEKKWPELPAKWIGADNLHITLVFLGDITDEELGQTCVIAKEVAQKHALFDIHLNKVTYGSDGKIPPRMIWAGGEKSKELSLLKRDLEEALLEKVNFLLDHKAFAPHVTLARIKEWEWRRIEPEERPEVHEDIDVLFTVESIDVMESKLTRQGPRYVIVESHQLQ
ncbi:MAG: 2'-5' RNA ligase [Candidatus Staskawiczbacteria bacterium RIFCSPLOWO2_01_FULL_40_39]|uniref:RNA 2',3'-cyclic phosphodiesterase n=1 Tax=Candidatus Staskawiczbacteria bacterium RIFCSPHIGHO2_01_FULL_39_25 TaxID=1802202 RepID=A0A1G2HM66_9BACT|nr:MAG: 2'-5' RNA ligase [Candidatus Staskawiczbacteria bacterium RIFCSPHIGHO2_01_FULL_39_25]OGZ73685.1 MAG: 2'-5' RNA ligase [Candidatus Staskawiczbacteria bacterium RIFCSPLOWO2_01_FULL_40_39]